MGWVISAVVESVSGTGMVERMASLPVVTAKPGHKDRIMKLVFYLNNVWSPTLLHTETPQIQELISFR